ncbi:hypothetical protein K466DRAFT_584453 [Polyporus arcularius HHB13444]|uniref:Uncharacterized protein n=1 Tax=Polyporus arcularius HHB13444 TaxID=1314778 RepID=A0A5C3PMY1_9APHY|nr:hypothetical protein K466DRAFT_584453 [Polyporus arcularius HHB13444]
MSLLAVQRPDGPTGINLFLRSNPDAPSEAISSLTGQSSSQMLTNSRSDILDIIRLSQQPGSLVPQRSSFEGEQPGFTVGPRLLGGEDEVLPRKLHIDRSRQSHRGEEHALSSACRTSGGRDSADPNVSSPRYVARTTQPLGAGSDTTMTMRSGSELADGCPPPPPYSQ